VLYKVIRLSKSIADSGYCSRRQAGRKIYAGDVSIDGKPALTDGWIDKSHVGSITINGHKLAPIPPKIYLIYNKPVGVDCNYSNTNQASLLGKIDHPFRVFPIGRLDKDSHGLLLLTNDGEFCQQLMHPDYHHPKTYRVRVSEPLKPDFAELMSAGVEILKTCTKPCQVMQTHRDEFEIVLTQGLNRQIRRMCKKLGYHVTDLQRLSILSFNLDRLEIGQWREIKSDELDTLRIALKSKANSV
jgi:pseudouridine synthase|tara:strand:- start:2431 stop:3159 length:729 start_codon:yes stop_codon:yes gene_type:complete